MSRITFDLHSSSLRQPFLYSQLIKKFGLTVRDYREGMNIAF